MINWPKPECELTFNSGINDSNSVVRDWAALPVGASMGGGTWPWANHDGAKLGQALAQR